MILVKDDLVCLVDGTFTGFNGVIVTDSNLRGGY